MKCTQRLYLTADKKKLVGAGHKDASTLYAVPGDEIPQSAADLFGLVDGHLKNFKPDAEKDESESKERPAPTNKEKAPGENKGGGAKADDLAKIAGVGPATAKALAAAGYASIASIAAIDPETPPTIEGLPPAVKWADLTASAKALAASDGGAA